MKSKLLVIVTMAVLSLMTGCTSGTGGQGQGQDPAAVKIELISDPSPASAKQNMKLIAQITGLETYKDANVQLDVRRENNEGLPEFLETQSDGKGRYSADTIFEKPGNYAIYIHLYQGELHITKQRPLEVK
ncbi:FixH family protein [Paenibacillus mendelii]|uniref:FixH family protein n=1 Tax=Paenibacillus mendelii TaxID=206163 RepID=A0ABV6JDJ8_9BACL|nr:FixH family protein [Paenibacillus mendelii]MCQ6562381.1 FixH family protein [Paenibacillus mendelii]